MSTSNESQPNYNLSETEKQKQQLARDKAVEIIMQRLKPILQGRINVNEEYQLTRVIANAIEKAQNY